MKQFKKILSAMRYEDKSMSPFERFLLAFLILLLLTSLVVLIIPNWDLSVTATFLIFTSLFVLAGLDSLSITLVLVVLAVFVVLFFREIYEKSPIESATNLEILSSVLLLVFLAGLAGLVSSKEFSNFLNKNKKDILNSIFGSVIVNVLGIATASLTVIYIYAQKITNEIKTEIKEIINVTITEKNKESEIRMMGILQAQHGSFNKALATQLNQTQGELEKLKFSLYAEKLLIARSADPETYSITESLQRVPAEKIPKMVIALSKVEITAHKNGENEMPNKKNSESNVDEAFMNAFYCQYLQKMANRCKQTFENLRAYKTIAGMPDNSSLGVLNCPIPIEHKS